jgi:hypothetical protein
MRIHLTILAASVMCAALTAQTTYQNWDMHPGFTSFTSRGNIGTGSGSIYQGVHSATNRGVLDVGGKCVIGRFNTISQDQNCRTQEKWGYVVRSGTDATGPFTASGAVLGRVLGLTTPPASGGCAFSITTTLAPRARISVPCTRMWAYGIEHGPSPLWTMDGMSTHASRGNPNTSTSQKHLSNNLQADQSWQILGTATAASNTTNSRSWRLSARGVNNAVLKLTCGGERGYGGSYPIASTSTAPKAWAARLDGGSGVSGAASVVAVGSSRLVGATFGTGARLYIGGPYLVIIGPAASASGVAVIPILPFVPASASGAGTFHLQAAFGTTSGIRLTNSQSVIP